MLSETANQQELFMVDECDDLGADSVISLVKVGFLCLTSTFYF